VTHCKTQGKKDSRNKKLFEIIPAVRISHSIIFSFSRLLALTAHSANRPDPQVLTYSLGAYSVPIIHASDETNIICEGYAKVILG
jgi:hypothetical protein